MPSRDHSRHYRKRPVVIEAIRFTGENDVDVLDFLRGFGAGWSCGKLRIYTLEGTMTVEVGDYIIRGVKGEFYPCKPDIFEETYEEAASHDA